MKAGELPNGVDAIRGLFCGEGKDAEASPAPEV